MKKEERKQRREVSYKASTESMEEVVRMAKIGYERFYELPDQSSTVEAIEKSSAGLLGWAQLAKANGDVDIMMKEHNEAHEVHPLSILTRAERSGISVVEQPSSDSERIEITSDSGACDTVLSENRKH